jgi:hypothetical protein
MVEAREISPYTGCPSIVPMSLAKRPSAIAKGYAKTHDALKVKHRSFRYRPSCSPATCVQVPLSERFTRFRKPEPEPHPDPDSTPPNVHPPLPSE